MKKVIMILLCVLTMLLLCGCKTEEQNDMKGKSIGTVTFTNGVTETDVWILSDTESNRKTTLWGTASISGIRTDESREAALCEPGGEGLYLARMIDVNKFYYSANGVRLEDGWALQISEQADGTYTLEVRDKAGQTQGSYEVFCARL